MENNFKNGENGMKYFRMYLEGTLINVRVDHLNLKINIEKPFSYVDIFS